MARWCREWFLAARASYSRIHDVVVQNFHAWSYLSNWKIYYAFSSSATRFNRWTKIHSQKTNATDKLQVTLTKLNLWLQTFMITDAGSSLRVKFDEDKHERPLIATFKMFVYLLIEFEMLMTRSYEGSYSAILHEENGLLAQRTSVSISAPSPEP